MIDAKSGIFVPSEKQNTEGYFFLARNIFVKKNNFKLF